MSYSSQIILLDSNAYFRIALSIHPLLQDLFGHAPSYALKVLEDLDKEFSRNRRLISKFHWVANPEYRMDRKSAQYSARGKTAPQVETALSYLSYQAKLESIDVSYVDLKALAVGYVRSFPVITDDRGMQKVAKIFDIECWSTLKLLRLMLDCERIDLNKVKEVVEYWDAENDLPMHINDFRKIYVEIFNGECPV